MNQRQPSGVPGGRAKARCARCAAAQPYNFLPAEKYEAWKDIEIDLRSARHVPRLTQRSGFQERHCIMTTIRSSVRLHAPARARRSAPPRRAGAMLRVAGASRRSRLDVTQGNVAADADRAAGFRRRHAGRRRGRARRHAGHRRQPAALRPVRADRPGGLHREDRQHRRAAALPRLAGDQRAGAGHRPRHAPGRRPAARPSSGCGTCSPASSSPASSTSPRRTTGAASRTSSPMRSTSG